MLVCSNVPRVSTNAPGRRAPRFAGKYRRPLPGMVRATDLTPPLPPLVRPRKALPTAPALLVPERPFLIPDQLYARFGGVLR